MLKINIPKFCESEQRYALEILLEEFLGLAFEIQSFNGEVIEITRVGEDSGNAKFTIDTSFFQKANEGFLLPESLPVLPLQNWNPINDGIHANLTDPNIPVLYGGPGLSKSDGYIHLNLDIFGSAFFMLSRYEELITEVRDKHDRFPAHGSIAFKSGFLERPLVDEYLEIFWEALLYLWPDLKRKNINSKILVSCDVDQPYDCTVETLPRLIKACAGDLLKRKNPLEMLKRINRYFFNKLGFYQFDRNHTFDWYMDLCEKAGFRATFFFIPSSEGPEDGCYEISDKKVIKLIQTIALRGHEIGVHSSYQTYQNEEKIFGQKLLLEKVLRNAGIEQKIRGNRQHYLRWDSAQTPDYLDAAGFEYDTTGSFADRPGFRYGTSKEFTMWGWQIRAKLRLKQIPLIIMESSVISESYLGLGYSNEAITLIMCLKKVSLQRGGNFALLWHNSHFHNIQDKVLFEKILFDEN